MRGSAVIFVIFALLALLLMGFFMFKDYLLNPQKTMTPSPSPTYSTFSEDPKYKDVKEKYNLSEEQLQILSTVNPEDNE